MRFTESLTPYDGTLAGNGFSSVRRKANGRHIKRVAECARMWLALKEGAIDPFFIKQAMHPTRESSWRMLCQEFPVLFNESMTSSDFGSLTVDALDRLLLASYLSVSMHYRSICKIATLRDFRTVKRYATEGAAAPFDAVEEGAGFNRRSISQGDPYTYAPQKYEAGGEISWEAAINDDLGIFNDFTDRLATGGRRTIEKSVTQLYCDANGPHASMFTNGDLNKVNTTCGAANNNPALSFDGIADALTVMYGQKDAGGDPIIIEGVTLVVPPAAYAAAENIKNAASIDTTTRGGSTNNMIRVNNWIIQNMEVVRNPYIPVVATNRPKSWFIFANPSTGRPALEIGFLPGFQEPQLFQKAPNTMRIGGGVDPMLGDFDTMCREFKALLVFGDARLEKKAAVGSDGSGS